MTKNAHREPRARHALWTLLIAGGLFALYFAGMGRYPLIDPDEPIYGEVAREMAAGAGWLTPHFDGKMWFDKPPLFYWLSAASMRVLGPTELALRLPSALLAVGLVLLVYALATHDFGRRAGALSSLVMATCLMQIVLARVGLTDMTLTFCLLAALYAYRRWLDAESGSRFVWAMLCGAMTGLGMLTKGPVAPVLLAGAIMIHLCWGKRLKRLWSLDAATAVLAFAVVGLPWYLAMYALHRNAFVQGFLVMNNITRFLKPEHSDLGGQWYSYLVNLPILLVFFFPWSAFLPQAISRLWRANEGARLAISWIAVVFLFFSISKTHLMTYAFPLYAAAALLVGVYWESVALGEARCNRGIRVGLWTNMILALLIATGLVLSARKDFPEARAAGWAAGTLLVVVTVCTLALTRRDSDGARRVAPWVMGGGMAVFALLLAAGIMPVVGMSRSARDVVEDIPRASGARVVQYKLTRTSSLSRGWVRVERPSILFYLREHTEYSSDAAAVRRLLAEKPPTFVICRKLDTEPIAGTDAIEIERSGGLVLWGNDAAVSLANEVPE